MDVHRLRVFRSVVASGSVQAAADHLGYTPSAVSQHINQLQRETGLALFEKAGRGIAPTAAGRLLARESEDAMGALARLDNVVSDLREGRTNNVSLACFASAGEEWVPRLVRRLRGEFPDLVMTVDLNEMPDDAGKRPAYDLDIRTEEVGESSVPPSGYVRHELVTEPYVVILSADHPLAAEPALTMAQLADVPWVDDSMEEQTCGRILRRAITQAGITPRVAARCQDHHTTFAFVAAGIGISLVPRLTLGSLPAAARAVPLVDPPVRRTIAVHVRDSASVSPAVRRAVELLREICTN